MSSPENTLARRIQTKFPAIVTDAFTNRGHETVVVKKESILPFLAALKKEAEFGFNVLMDLTAVDYLHWEEKELRFELVYNLFSTAKNQRLFVKVPLTETDPSLDSVLSLWPAADWYEREVWDMFGIVFKGHPDLKRILMYEGFKGHPLRKDYAYNKRQPIAEL